MFLTSLKLYSFGKHNGSTCAVLQESIVHSQYFASIFGYFYDTLCKRGKYVVLQKLCLLITFIRAIFQPLT